METGDASRVRRGHTPFTEEKPVMAVRLFVGNLPYDVTEAELRAHFAAIGPLASLSLATDRDTGKPRGFAFVEFSARDAPAPPSAPRPTAPRPPVAADTRPD